MKNKKWNNTKKKQRYGKYYYKIMAPVWEEYWQQDLKRVQKLKKQILALGPVPQKEVQVIKTSNYFVKLINLLTNFVDTGALDYAPPEKFEQVSIFNEMMRYFVGRKKSALCYWNTAEPKKSVTSDNLYIGLFELIDNNENIKKEIQTKVVHDMTFRVIVDYAPLLQWINGRVATFDGYAAGISQKALVHHINQITNEILKDIDDILND